MADQAEQQAVTVAQEDISIGQAVYRDFLMGDLDHEHGEYEGERCAMEAAARVRLASVSSASAEGVDFRALLIEAGRNAGAFIDDRASDAFLKFIPEEVRLKIERVSASPEPVPATNQAGGVELVIAALRAERAKPLQGPEHGAWDRGRRYGLDDAIRIAASLATQPATSQEGEVCALCSGKGFADAPCPVCMIAATPTPPTLSEDLRVLVGTGHFLLDRLVDHEVRMTSDDDAREWYGHVTPAMERFRAALAQVKAS